MKYKKRAISLIVIIVFIFLMAKIYNVIRENQYSEQKSDSINDSIKQDSILYDNNIYTVIIDGNERQFTSDEVTVIYGQFEKSYVEEVNDEIYIYMNEPLHE